jgi:hypothetical protein
MPPRLRQRAYPSASRLLPPPAVSARLLRLLHAAALTACLAGGGLLAGCLGDAERGNPLDPRSDNFRDAGGVPGTVVRASRPSEGVPGAVVRLFPDGGGAELVVSAASNGRFSFSNVPTGRYLATAAAAGYPAGADSVEVEAGRLSPELNFQLNALPQVAAQSLRSERINRYFPEPPVFSQIVVEATVLEPDGVGDLRSVEFVIPDPADPDTVLFRAPLVAVPGEEGRFRQTILEENLPVSLQDLLGRNLFIEVSDESGAVVRGSDLHVVRIVEAIPQAVGPLTPGVDFVRPPFVLRWAPLALPYTFTWRVEMVFVPVAGLEQPPLVFSGIPRDQTTLEVTTSLPAGNYAWRVSAVDEFGNSARSREAGFTVLP